MKRIAGILLLAFVSLIKLEAQCAISGSLNVCVGSTSQLTGENPPAEGNPWSSSAPEVATVSTTGLVTGISAGSCTITYTNTACSSSVTMNVSSNTVPAFTQPGPYCIGATPAALPLTSINGITGTWNPSVISTATPGSTDYTFTPTSGQCASGVTITVVVNDNSIVPLFAQPGPYCAGASIPALPTTSTNGIAGSWNPSVIDNLATTTYTFTPSSGQCAVQTTLTITINAAITPSFNTPGPYCAGSSIPALPTTSLNSITGTWSPSINNNATTAYTFTPNSGQCATTASLTIIITPNTVPEFNTAGPYCTGASIPDLPTTSLNGVTGTWNPSINNTETTTYTFTPTAGQCAVSTTLTITVNQILTPSFNAVGPYCSGATIPALPTTSLNSVTGTWSPAINNTNTTTYTFTPNSGQCATTAFLTITITPNTVPVFNSAGPYCAGASIPALPTTSTNGIIGTWSPSINNTATTTYTFTPNSGQCATTAFLTITITPNTVPSFNSAGPYCAGASIPALPTTSLNGITGTWSPAINNNATTIYTFTPSAGQCAVTTTLTITINPVITPAFNSAGPYCAGASIPALPTTSTNGINGTWSPAINNTATTIYTFTPSAGQCAVTTTLTITINPVVTPAFNSAGPYCAGATIPALPTTSLNGITGTWSPALNNNATTTYTFTPSAGQCAVTTTLTITINPVITPAFNATGPYCAGASIPALPTTSANGITGTWSPAINNTATTTYTFTPSAGQCAVTTTLTITINPVITPAFNSAGPYCSGASIPALPTTSTNGITGTWSPAINNTSTTTYTFTPSAGQCAVTTTLTITINPIVTPAFNSVGPYCSGASIPALPTTSTNGITGTWSPAINNTSTTTYTFTPSAGQCAVTTTLRITINPIITPAFNSVGPYCSGASIPALPTTSTNGITGTWSPAINNNATTTYTFTPNTGQCASTANLTITITPNTLPSFNTMGPYCSGASIPALPTTSLNGITGTWSPSINNTATTTYTFTPSAGLCALAATMTITINPVPSPPAVGTSTQPSCAVATGSVPLSGLPSSGTWTVTRSPGGVTSTGSGSTTTISGISQGTYTFTVTNSSGCISAASTSVTINSQPVTPSTPVIGTITHPTCSVPTGTVPLSGLPSSGSWTVTMSPGAVTTSGSGATTTITGVPAGSYTFTVTNSSGCTSASSTAAVLNSQPLTPTVPVTGTIVQPSCTVATGSVPFSGLPSSGTWTLTRSPGNVTTTGSGTSTTITGLAAGTYTYSVTNSSGCTSLSTASITINPQPVTPSAPLTGTITQPTCSVATGSVPLTGLPSTGTWTVTRTPGAVTTSGTGTGTTISGITAGTYTFTVTNASGCISAASTGITINEQPVTPVAPAAGELVQPSCTVATGSLTLNGLPSSGTWTLTRTPGGTTITGTGTTTTITGLPAGTFTYAVTNASGCTSLQSAGITINPQPVTPTAPLSGNLTQPTCTVATGSIQLTGLPSTGTWTLGRTPGNITSTGSGTATTIAGLASGTYSFTVTNSFGCTSASSPGIVINAQPVTPSTPVIGAITQPTCTVATGSAAFSGLPAAGSWTITRMPGVVTTSGSGTATTISGLTAGTYSFTVTNSVGCTSTASPNVAINTQPPTPSAPLPGAVVQPSLDHPAGSIALNGLPSSGSWTLHRQPGGINTSGSGTSTTISGLEPGSYTFTVTNSAGCTSAPTSSIGLYLLKLYGTDNRVIKSGDTIKITSPEAGSFTFRVESNSDWKVADNALWFKAIKESPSSIKVTYSENISVMDKTSSLVVTYTSNPDVKINISQQGRISQIKESKLANAKLYPNPAGDFLYMKHGNFDLDKIVVTIADLNGHIIMVRIFEGLTAGEITEINVSRLPVGQFLFRITDGSDSRTFRFIKY